MVPLNNKNDVCNCSIFTQLAKVCKDKVPIKVALLYL